MQSLGAATLAEIKASAQVPLFKFEIYYGAAWVDLCALDSKNYLMAFSLSLGGATMSPAPVAGTWSATINNPDGAFLPANADGAYKDYLTTGRKVRISWGGTFAGGNVYWTRIYGVMDSPKFTIVSPQVQLKGMDYAQYLTDYKLRNPNNYWGTSTSISTVGPVETLGSEIYAEADAMDLTSEADNVTNWATTGVAAVSSVADAGGAGSYVMKILFGTGSAVVTYDTAGSFLWTCPTGVTSVQVECWGAGGGGAGTGLAGNAQSGGGGGAYAKSNAIAVTAGTQYVVQVGQGGWGGGGAESGRNGGASYFSSVSTTYAAGGEGGEYNFDGTGDAGAAGTSAGSVGDTKYSGGNGAARGGSGGGGGGSSAGTGVNGNDGSAGSGVTGGAGGAAPAGGGAGGDGGDHDDSGSSAVGVGGGGGGAGERDTSGVGNGGDGKAGKVVLTYTGTVDTDTATNTNVGAVTAGHYYKIAFNYKRSTGPGTMACRAYIGTERQGEVTGCAETTYGNNRLYFTATATDNVILEFEVTGAATNTEFRISGITFKEVTVITHTRNYAMPDECTGIYYATLDGVPIWYGEDPDGWFYDADHNEFQFHPNKILADGTNNLICYYHTAQLPEYVVADILVSVGLYANRPLALAAMTYTSTGIVIDRVWFEAGTSALDAIRMICERCNYRFYFKYDGTPVFIAEPSIKAAGSEDLALEECHPQAPAYYEDSSEIFNVVAIDGESIAQPLGTEQTMASNYKGTATDATSQAAYGDRTKSIKNHLFQSDAVCASMAATLLAAYKDPKKYLEFVAAINPIPVELGDTVRVQLKISPDLGYGSMYDMFLYDAGPLYDTAGTILILRGKVRDIKINKTNATYRLELA